MKNFFDSQFNLIRFSLVLCTAPLALKRSAGVDFLNVAKWGFISGLFFTPFNVIAQTPITAVSTSYITATTGTSYTDNGLTLFAGNTYNYTYGNLSGTTNNDLKLSALTAGGSSYNYLSVPGLTVKMRRVDNAVVAGIRNLKFNEAILAAPTIAIACTYDDDMEHFFTGNASFNSGSDNIFCNQGDGNGNNNNIERVDVIVKQGIKSPDNTKIGFALFERGNTGANDPVKVAAILSVDAAGNPTSYSPLLSLTSGNYGTAVPAFSYVITRRDNAVDTHLRISAQQSQPYGGIFLKFSDFGIANNTAIYGYSVIPSDFAGTSAAGIADYTNAAFYPTNTSNATGGIDLVSFTGILQNGPYTLLPLVLNAFTATVQDQRILLDWQTDNEINISHFELQRGPDANEFSSIAYLLPAAGAGKKEYHYADAITGKTAGSYYYRLKMINTDDAYYYSAVKLVSVKNGATSGSDPVLYPNPVVDKTSLIIPSRWQNKAIDYTLLSADGKTIFSGKIARSGSAETINTAGLLPGIYLLELGCAGESVQKKIIRQ